MPWAFRAPPSNGQITSPCNPRQRGKPDIAKKPSWVKGQIWIRKFQTFSVSTSFRRGRRIVRAGGVAGRPADMAKSSEWRTEFGRFWLRRGTGFAGLDGCKDCARPGTETGEKGAFVCIRRPCTAAMDMQFLTCANRLDLLTS